MSLTICNCILKLDSQSGVAYTTAELISEPRKSQVNTSDALYISKLARSQARNGIIIQDLLYIETGNALMEPTTVQYTAGGVAGSELVTVVNSTITVQISSGVSTAAQIKAAVDATSAATNLVTVVTSGTASNTQVNTSVTSLTDSYCYLPLVETTTNSQQVVFRLNWVENTNYGSLIFDPIEIPNQAFVDLSTLLTVVRG